MTKVTITCFFCSKKSEKPIGEINRRIRDGADKFFCSTRCSVMYGNKIRPDRRSKVNKICPTCEKEFETMTGAKSPTFCSRSCASLGSVTEKRRNAQSKSGKNHSKNLMSPFESLKLREMWKYEKLKKFFDFQKIKYEFEHVIDCYSFDLVIFDKMVIIEFDGPYHSWEKQKESDVKKDKFAKSKNYSVIRIKVPQNSIIEPEVLYHVL